MPRVAVGATEPRKVDLVKRPVMSSRSRRKRPRGEQLQEEWDEIEECYREGILTVEDYVKAQATLRGKGFREKRSEVMAQVFLI